MRPAVLDDDGATAVEFALVSPVVLLTIVFLIQLGITVQRWTALQAISDATARCIAIATPACPNPTSGIAYAVQLAGVYGVPNFSAAMVTVSNGMVGTVLMEQVTITYPLNVSGFSASLTASGAFPIP